ncbi:MAG: DoxX family membrane protein [Bacteroides sp.]|nr:DoxX family membrane protein [Bacteroides sp.]
MKYVKLASRILLGLVFIFSGFVKAVDPLGSAYKFADYFTAFKLGFLEFSVLPLAIALAAFELLLGIALLLGYRRKIVYTVLLWFMLFFTALTFILAIFNPVSDCGCFGDALILTNWQTFLKNVVLMLFVLLLYFSRKKEAESLFPIREWILIGTLYLGASLFSVWNFKHLPLIDFRPYDVGTVISDEMGIPEGMPVDEYETELIYRNKESGKEQTFTMDNYPKDTLEWTFVNSESKLLKKGYEPPIHDFALVDGDGNEMVDEILSNRDYTLLMVSYDLEEANESALLKAGDWAQLEILAGDFSFHAVTATTSAGVEEISDKLGLEYDFLAADEIMLKTIVRSNPGFVLLHNGVILGKWGHSDFPSVDELDSGWTELIGNAAAPMDADAEMLIEAGIYEEFSFDVIDFERIVPSLIIEAGVQKHERGVVIGFSLSVLLLMLILCRLSPLKV